MPIWLAGYEGIMKHCPKFSTLFAQLGRPDTDIDFVSVHEQRPTVIRVFMDLGYVSDRQIVIESEGLRCIFVNTARATSIDVFFDALDFCHPLRLRNRLFSTS